MMKYGLLGFLALVIATPLSVAQAGESSSIRSSFASSFATSSAGGDLRVRMSETGAALRVRVRGLAPDSAYRVGTGGLIVGEIVTDETGSADARLDLLNREEGIAPTGDVRFGDVDISSDREGVVLGSNLYDVSASDPPGTRIRESTSLRRVPDAEVETDGAVDVRYESDSDGRERLVIWLRGLDSVVHTVNVNGLIYGVTPDRRGNAVIDLRSELDVVPRRTRRSLFIGPLIESPRLAMIEVSSPTDRLFRDLLLARIPGINSCDPEVRSSTLERAPGQETGSAIVELSRDDRCHVGLVLTAADLEPGAHAILIDEEIYAFRVEADGSARAEYDEDPMGAGGGEVGWLGRAARSGVPIELVRVEDFEGQSVFFGELP